jgi:chitodextrinase
MLCLAACAAAVAPSHVVAQSGQAEGIRAAAFARGWQNGTPVTVTGEVTVLYADDFANNRAEQIYLIWDEASGRSFRVRFAGESPENLRPGTRTSFTGRARQSELYVLSAAADPGSTTSSSAAQTPVSSVLAVTGDQHTLVMAANFIDATVACSVSGIRDTMFTDPGGYSVAELYRNNSRGQVSFSGDVVGSFTIDSKSTDTCDLFGWSAKADAAAAASGVDVASYSRKVYVMPPNSCDASGFSTMSGSPSRAWVFSCALTGLYAHELGHNLGMDHASTPASEYGDPTDPMSTATSQLRGLNAPHRHELGWLASDRLMTITQSGNYDIAPLADPAASTTPQVITIRKPDTGELYYLSYRLGYGFDQYISGWYNGRLSIHRYKGDASGTRTFLLAGLLDGENFVDQTNGITVTMLNHSITGATARIEIANPCQLGTPTVGLAPKDQSAVPGASVKYAVSVVNKDALGCPSSSFALTTTVPGGWDATVSPSTITIAPGGSASAELTVHSPSTTAVGTYNVYLDLNDRATPVHGTLGSGSYTVAGDAIPPSPPAGLTATANQKLKQIDLSWSGSNDNVSVAGYRVVRNGSAVATAKTTKWADATWTPGATYTYSVIAYDGAGNASPQSNSVTVKLSGGDGATGGGGGNGGGKR